MADSTHSSVYHTLGGGAVADVLLWKKRIGGAVLLVSSTLFWLLFEKAGYNILRFVSNVLLLLVAILFFWAKSAATLNRPLPPLPDLEVSEEVIFKAAEGMRVWINRALLIAHDIAIVGDVKLLIEVVAILWMISFIGSFFNFLTLLYIGVLLSLSVPFLYEKYQDQIDEKLIVAQKVIEAQYRKLDDKVLKKIPFPKNKDKKTQ